MQTFSINVNKNPDGYEIVVSGTKDNKSSDIVLAEDMNENNATDFIASLKLVLLQYFKDYEPFA